MRRFLANVGLVAVAFLLLWTLLVVIEVKAHPYSFLKYIFFVSLPAVFICFFVAAWKSFSHSDACVVIATVSALLISPLLIYFGVVLVTNFKLLIGGRF
jgi:hypothetical protein